MRVHHLNCGTLRPFGVGPVDGEGERDSPFARAELVCHCLLIETPGGLVLVDTGLGLKDVDEPACRLGRAMCAIMRPALRREETAAEQVRALGHAPSDVRHIVLTHLDFDQAGGIEDFPHAKVHVYAEELNAATHGHGALAELRYRPRQWDRAVQWKTYVAHGRPWYGLRCVRDLDGLPPGILMVPLVGHTLGHCGVAVHSGNGWLLHAGDAYFHRDEVPQGVDAGTAPSCPRGLRLQQRLLESDRVARRRNQQRLRKLAARHGDEVRIFCTHDPVEFDQLARDAEAAATHAPDRLSPHFLASARRPLRTVDRYTAPPAR